MADVADGGAGAHHLDAAHHRLMGDIHQAPRLHPHFADAEHAAGVAVPAIEDDGHIDVEHVAVLQALGAGDAVAHHVVHRGADGFGEAPVVEGRRDGAVGLGVIVTEPVELVRRHLRAHVGCDVIEGLGGQAPGLAHGLEFLGAVQLDAPAFARRVFHACVVHGLIMALLAAEFTRPSTGPP